MEGLTNFVYELKALFDRSEGVSETFGYFPIIFVKDNAYSGFNDQVKEGIPQAIALSGGLYSGSQLCMLRI